MTAGFLRTAYRASLTRQVFVAAMARAASMNIRMSRSQLKTAADAIAVLLIAVLGVWSLRLVVRVGCEGMGLFAPCFADELVGGEAA